MRNWFPTADRLTQILRDWNVHWRHLGKNSLKTPVLHMIHLLEFPCESQLCTWMELSFVCVFLFGWTFAANGTCPAECWLLRSPCFFVNLNEKGRGGRGSPSGESPPSCLCLFCQESQTGWMLMRTPSPFVRAVSWTLPPSSSKVLSWLLVSKLLFTHISYLI